MDTNLTKKQVYEKLENIVIIGNGGRENSLAWAIQKNKLIKNIYLIPGNGGSGEINKCQNLHIDYENKNLLIQTLNSLEIDLIILAGFMRILGKNITEKFYGKMINLHPSLLPLYPGLNTHAQALNNKDKYHGISIHFVTAKLDEGPLIAQGKILIKEEDDIEKLIARIHKIEHDLLPKVINELCLNNIYLNCETHKVMYSNILDSKMFVTYFNN